MKQERFKVEQIRAVLKQAEAGVPVVELTRRVGISEQPVNCLWNRSTELLGQTPWMPTSGQRR